MSVTYPDLTNDYPDVSSDERYLYRDIALDDIDYIKQYETLLNAVKTAGSSELQTAWEALEQFKSTDNYKQHVYPVMMAAEKLQTLEDKVISAQRYAKSQKQQWQITNEEPESGQAVNDMWLQIKSDNDVATTVIPHYKDETGQYKELAFGMRIVEVSQKPESPDPYTLYVVTEG